MAKTVAGSGITLTYDSGTDELEIAAVGGSGAVDSVNGLTGVVVLDPDDLDDSATTNKFATAAELTKLGGIEALADVTDAANVEAAGAVMVADTATTGYGFVVDEDAMTSDSATKLPTQQSVKAYVDAAVLSAGSYTDEQARDALGAALTAGTGITVTPDDVANTITIASTITQYTDEMARDALGTALTGGANITVTPNDGADTITIAVSGLAESNITGLVSDLATLTSGVAAKMTSPMTTQDDLIIGGAAGAPARLAKGTDGQVLTVDPSTHHLLWATPASGFSNPMTTAGDLIYENATPAPARLPIGTTAQVLTVVAGAPAWADPAAGADVAPRPGSWYSKVMGITSNMTLIGVIPAWNFTSGVGSTDDDANGVWLKYGTGATSGNSCGAGSASFIGAQRGWGSVMKAWLKLIDVANVRLWIGLFGGNPSGSAAPSVHLAAFRFDTGAGDAHWQAVTNSGGGTQTVTDTGVTPASGDRPVMEIRLSGSNVVFLLNGAIVATHTTNLPGATTDLGYQEWITTLAAAAKQGSVGTVAIWSMGRS